MLRTSFEKIQIEALISCKGLTTIEKMFQLQLTALKFQVIEGHGWSLVVKCFKSVIASRTYVIFLVNIINNQRHPTHSQEFTT